MREKREDYVEKEKEICKNPPGQSIVRVRHGG